MAQATRHTAKRIYQRLLEESPGFGSSHGTVQRYLTAARRSLRATRASQELKDIFAYIGGVPQVVVFDNATGVGRRIGQIIHETRLFQLMRAHYRFSVRFCNPQSGQAKGNVESKIGYTRRNLVVPEPAFDDIVTYNRQLLDQHEVKAVERHYKKLLPIKELFLADRPAPGDAVCWLFSTSL